MQKKNNAPIAGMQLTPILPLCICENCNRIKMKNENSEVTELKKKTFKSKAAKDEYKQAKLKKHTENLYIKHSASTIYYGPSLIHYNYIFADVIFFLSVLVASALEVLVFGRSPICYRYSGEPLFKPSQQSRMKNWRNLIKINSLVVQPLVLLPSRCSAIAILLVLSHSRSLYSVRGFFAAAIYCCCSFNNVCIYYSIYLSYSQDSLKRNPV